MNFSDERLEVISILSPVPWKDDGMGTTIPPVEDAKYFVPGIKKNIIKFDGNPF
jgi:hypothetical protein